VKRGWRWLVPLAAVPVLTLLAYGFALNPRDVPSPLVGRPAASFALTSFDGARLQLSELRGKVVVVNFWASWCYPACYEEAPALERSWRAYRDRGVVVLGVAIQECEVRNLTVIVSRHMVDRLGIHVHPEHRPAKAVGMYLAENKNRRRDLPLGSAAKNLVALLIGHIVIGPAIPTDVRVHPVTARPCQELVADFPRLFVTGTPKDDFVLEEWRDQRNPIGDHPVGFLLVV
jgi:thiol-disulfide isomerase/thioredoxin